MNSAISSRLCALHALSRTLDARQPLEASLSGAPGYGAMIGSERAFALTLAKTTLKRLGQCDALLSAWMESPLPPGARIVRHVLRLGLAQALFMDVPPHAAVHTTVELAKEAGAPRFSGLVNALMQRAVREGVETVVQQDAARLNMPAWLWESWGEAARGMAEAHLLEAPLDISVKSAPAGWAARLGGEVVEGYTVRLHEPGAVTQLPGFAEGEWWVQDAAAALPVRMLAEAMGGLAGKRIIDLCAAPGGKTAQLAAMGAAVTAVDISEARLRTLRENMARLKLEAEVVASDALKFVPAAPSDAILLDAPCSATGTLRRHPDIAYHRTVEDVARLSVAQHRLIRHAWSLLPPGGFLCYAVCSVQPQEEGDFPAPPLLTRRTRPGDALGGDGFYVAVVKK